MGELLLIDFAARRLAPVVEAPKLAKPAPEFRPRYCDPDNVVTGAEYKPGVYLDVKEIAKRVRAAVKAEMPQIKVGVRIERFSMGQAVDITIKALPGDAAVWMPRPEHEFDANRTYSAWVHTQEAKAAKAQLTEIGNRWNRQNCDGASDYFDVQYYLHVNFEEWAPQHPPEAA